MSDVKRRGKKPPTLQDEKVGRLLAALSTGHYMQRACNLARISPSTVYWWLDEAEKITLKQEKGESITERDQQYLDLADQIKQAKESAAHLALSKIILAASAGTWQAAAWYLERTDAEHYARRTQITGAESGPVKVDVSVDDVTALLKRILDEDDDTRE
jgi:hypothetical protein